jgi:hypothetical protein
MAGLTRIRIEPLRKYDALFVIQKLSVIKMFFFKHSVETHGGSISVESKVGQGSTFSLFLPIKCKN